MSDVVVARARGGVGGVRPVPPSKSCHLRALALAALAAGGTVVDAAGAEPGEDVRRMETAVRSLGPWVGEALGAGRDRLVLDLGLGATPFRLCVALATLRPAGARTLVTGRPALRGRPHRPLLRALSRLGAHVRRRPSGAVRVIAGGVRGGAVTVSAATSSQHASALLVIAPRLGGLEIRVPPPVVSRPYLDLTAATLCAFGVAATVEAAADGGLVARAPAAVPRAERYVVPGDASSATAWWCAAALTGGRVRVPRVTTTSGQADLALLPILERMGAAVLPAPDDEVEVVGPGGRLRGAGRVDLGSAPDLLPYVGALAAGAVGPTRITGAAHARFKETDRLATTVAGIQALGGQAHLEGDDVVIEGRALTPGRVDATGDHRIAIAFGVLGLAVGDVVIGGAGSVDKSWPTFFRDLEAACA